MYINEYGNRNDPTVLLLSPMMVSGEDLYRSMSPYFHKEYHFIAPDQGGHGKAGAYRSADEEYKELKRFLLDAGYTEIELAYDGFNPSEPETEFRSVAWEARGLEDYILQNYDGKVDILYGLSYGCRTLMQVLEDDRLQITTTIADGMSLRDYPDIKSETLKEIYLFFFTGTFFVIMGRAGKLRKHFLAKITGRSPEEADRILYTKASWQSWKNQDKCLIGKKTDYSAFAHTDMHIWYGIKGTVDKKLSANLEELKAKGYPFTCKIFEDMGHGGLVGENTERFIQEVDRVHRHKRENTREG